MTSYGWLQKSTGKLGNMYVSAAATEERGNTKRDTKHHLTSASLLSSHCMCGRVVVRAGQKFNWFMKNGLW